MYSPKIYLGAIWEIFVEEVLDKLPKSIRKRLCWLFGHRYLGIAFKSKSDNPDAYVSVADTEHGCVFCGHSKPNDFPMLASDIDFEKTKHRKEPPKHNIIPEPVS